MKRALQVILVVAGIFAVLFAGAWGLAVWFLGPYLIWAPEGVHVSAQAPSAVAVGDAFELTLNIRNDGPGDRVLEAISVEMDYLDGFSLEGIAPPADSTQPATEHRVYRFQTPIPAGGVTPIRFTLRATGKDADRGQGLRQGRFEVQFVGESRIARTSVITAIAPRG